MSHLSLRLAGLVARSMPKTAAQVIRHDIQFNFPRNFIDFLCKLYIFRWLKKCWSHFALRVKKKMLVDSPNVTCAAYNREAVSLKFRTLLCDRMEISWKIDPTPIFH